jgi:peptide/nickel transport system substrate-binding protein
MKKCMLMLFVLYALTFALVACGGEGSGIKRVAAGKSITVLRSDKSGDLDPQSTSSGGDVRVLSQMYEQLVRASVGTPEVEWLPGLAESWEINDDHTVYTFKIRQGIKFHDGTDLNAHAVKRSLDRIVVADDPSRPPARPYRDSYFGEVQSVEAPDDWTVVITHVSPNPRFLSTLGLHSAMIISPKAIKHMETLASSDERRAWLTKNPAGTGAFTIARPRDYQSDEQITLTRFDDYWGGKPTLERIVFQTQTDRRTRTQRILSGDVHFVDSLDPPDWPRMQEAENVTLYTWQGQNLCYLAMNCNPDHGHITADRNVREAIALAINREPFVAKFGGGAVAQHVLIPPTMLGHPQGYKPEADSMPRSQALEKARKLIEDGGHKGARLRMYYPDTERGYLLYPDEFANFIQTQLAEIGLEVQLDKAPLAELTPRVHRGDYPLVLIGWMGDTGEPDNFWRPLLSGRGEPAGNNMARFHHPEVEEMVNRAGVETDPERRTALYHEIEKRVHNEFRPMVPLISAQQSYAWAASLKDVEVDSTGTFRFHKASFEE